MTLLCRRCFGTRGAVAASGRGAQLPSVASTVRTLELLSGLSRVRGGGRAICHHDQHDHHYCQHQRVGGYLNSGTAQSEINWLPAEKLCVNYSCRPTGELGTL